MNSQKRNAYLKLLFLFVSLRIAYASRETIRCIDEERRALLTFKHGLGTGYDDILSSWGSEEEKRECCNWRGIRCSNTTAHVIALNLSSGGRFSESLSIFDGMLSPSLLDLKHLILLDLSHCRFDGQQQIPEFIGSFKKLQHLRLYDSGFGGGVPDQLGNLTNLKTLDLSWNSLEFNNLEWLPRLSSLTLLDLSWSIITDPNWLQHIMKLPSLQELHLSYCYNIPQINTPPPKDLFVNSSSRPLSILHLANTGLNSLAFRWLCNVSTSLTSLDLSYNNIEGPIPDALEKWISLEYLDLSNNSITGSVPDLRAFLSLRELHLRHNNLKGLTNGASIQQLSKLEILDVSYNSIEGTIRQVHLSQLHNLKRLDLSYNSFAVKINPDWIPPFQLNVLRLGGCTIWPPTFPKWIQTQSNISQLDLSSAGIVDVVPEWFWDLSPRLEYLNLSHNQISGTVADLSSNFVGLPFIDISFNNFSGPLPLTHPNSTVLQLSNNMFQGSISSICRGTYPSLGMLDLSDNQLSGSLPDCWINMKNLRFLDLANNIFSGEIPHNICPSSGDLETLNLRNNNLSGELPSNMKNCERLRVMDVGENGLVGNIPSWMGTHLASLGVLSLRYNKFYGGIPLNICNITTIQVLDLSRNNISGRIPQCFNNYFSMGYKNITFETSYSNDHEFYIDNAIVQWKGHESKYGKTLTFLKLIDLSSNKLSGSIPHEFCLLKGLVALNLSRNHLTGKIDSDIGQMEMLECLDLSRNQISGVIPTGLAKLNFLSILDLSNNNLSGKIPLGTQLESLDASVYDGNSELCGHPLKLCPSDDPRPSLVYRGEREEDGGITGQGFYISMAVGFIVGLWGVIATFMLNKSRKTVCFIF